MEYVLTHHGVKGMKWGVRKSKKQQRDEIRNAESKAFNKEYKRLSKEAGIDKKKDEAIAFGQKHGLDLDDGGGGNAKAGAKYMDMWDDISALENDAYHKASKYATDYVNGKYGEKAVKDLKRHDTITGTIAVTAVMASPLAFVAAVNLASYGMGKLIEKVKG